MVLCLCSCFMVFGNDDSEAASDATYGTISEFNLAPGFKWTYTPTYPSDLSVTTTILKQGTNTSSGTSSSIVSGTWASISGNTVTVQVPSGAAVGSLYDIILEATTSTGGITQTAYQYLRVNVTAGITASGTACSPRQCGHRDPYGIFVHAQCPGRSQAVRFRRDSF